MSVSSFPLHENAESPQCVRLPLCVAHLTENRNRSQNVLFLSIIKDYNSL